MAWIRTVHGRPIWDSRGRPTIEVEVVLDSGVCGRAVAPAGASTGSAEALDRRDGDDGLGGFGVTRALDAVNNEIANALRHVDTRDPASADRCLDALDPGPRRTRLGGNATIATSMAIAHAAAAECGMPLWRFVSDGGDLIMPLPEVQIFGGGVHADHRVDVQDFMVIPFGATTYADALTWAAEIYYRAGELLRRLGRRRGVADEGGYWPEFDSDEQGIELLTEAIANAGFRPGEDVGIALDVAASELWHEGRYRLRCETRDWDRDGWIELLSGWVDRHPLVSIEDPCAEHDLEGMRLFTAAVGDRVQIVADDGVVTSARRIREVALNKAANAALIKPNQAGTLSAAREAAEAAKNVGWGTIASARSGESEDTTIMHLAVGWRLPQIKVGALARGERTAKWNEGLRIAEQLPNGGRLAVQSHFPWSRNDPGA